MDYQEKALKYFHGDDGKVKFMFLNLCRHFIIIYDNEEKSVLFKLKDIDNVLKIRIDEEKGVFKFYDYFNEWRTVKMNPLELKLMVVWSKYKPRRHTQKPTIQL